MDSKIQQIQCRAYVEEIFSFTLLTRAFFFIFLTLSFLALASAPNQSRPFLLFVDSGTANAWHTLMVSLNILFFFYALLFGTIAHLDITSPLKTNVKYKLLGRRVRSCKKLFIILPLILIARELFFNQAWTLLLFPLISTLVLTIAVEEFWKSPHIHITTEFY